MSTIKLIAKLKLPNMGKNKKQAAGPMKKDKLTPAQKKKIKQENKAKSKGTTLAELTAKNDAKKVKAGKPPAHSGKKKKGKN